MFWWRNPVLLRLVTAIVLPLWAMLGGRWRLSTMRDELDPDWQGMVAFGAALRAFTQSGGKDAKALAALVALAPDIEPLVLGAHASRDALFAHLETLPLAFGDPATEPTATERRRLENLRGQVLGAEWLLQTEMKQLSQKDTRLNSWVALGVSGVLLFLVGRSGARTAAQRTRRRSLELDPRFAIAVRVAVAILFVGSFLLAFGSASRILAEVVRRAAHPPGT